MSLNNVCLSHPLNTLVVRVQSPLAGIFLRGTSGDETGSCRLHCFNVWNHIKLEFNSTFRVSVSTMINSHSTTVQPHFCFPSRSNYIFKMDSSQASHRSPETYDLDANTSSVYIKPPPADEEPFDASPQQQAQEPTVIAPSEMASSSRALSEATATATEPQFSEKSADDLIAMIHHLQASHAQELADLRDQQAALSNQLDQMKSLLNSHFTSQLGAIHLLQSVSLANS